MALSNIQPGGSQPNNKVQREREMQQPEEAKEQTRAEKIQKNMVGGPAKGESVNLGENSARVDANAMLLERILSRTEIELPPQAREMFEAAGKAEFQAANAPATDGAAFDASPEATAGRIVDGITGYIFKAWQTQHPEMTEESFSEFQSQVMKGFEQGVEEAKDIITGLQAMTPETQESINQTESLVREQLDDFFNTTMEQIQEGAFNKSE
ncbi:MAG: DUF5610 domain-containing protein [Candidatus Sumerlaeia bacterium]